MRTFASEDQRKDKLFVAWIEYLDSVWDKVEADDTAVLQFERTFEGLATVTGVNGDYLNLELETLEKIKRLPVSSEVCEHQRVGDILYLTLGISKGVYWPFDVTSIGSMVPAPDNKTGLHLTINPLVLAHQSEASH
jgi:hypothetical protein